MYKLGIVTATLNSEKFLKYTYESISEGIKDENCRYLIIDSGSTDNTLNFCSEKKINVLFVPKGNMYKAINYGLMNINTEWVTYVNSDDLLNIKAVLDAIDMFGDNADIIYGNTTYIDSDQKFIFSYRGAPITLFDGLFLSGQLPFSQPGTIIKASLYQKLNKFSEQYKYASDLDFFISAYLNGARFRKYKFNDLASFRIHKNQATNVYSKIMKYEIKDIIKKNHDKLKPKFFGLDKFIYKFINIDSYFSKLIYLFKNIKSI